MTVPLVTMKGMRKQFGPVAANDGVDLDIRAGEVLALLARTAQAKAR